MIWSDKDILRNLESKRISIENMLPEAVQPASVDLRLGNTFRFWPRNDSYAIWLNKPVPEMKKRIVPDGDYIVLWPQQFMLGHTIERVSLANDVVARLEGKSSIGRLGLTIHSTAGFIDPGNQDLSITLEIYNQSSNVIYLSPGVWIAQLAFQDLSTAADVPYGPERGSRYYGDHEPVPSKVHLNSMAKES